MCYNREYFRINRFGQTHTICGATGDTHVHNHTTGDTFIINQSGQTHTKCKTTGDTYDPYRTSGDKCVSIGDTSILNYYGKHIPHILPLGTRVTIGDNSQGKHIRHMGPLGTHMFLIPQVGTHELQSGTLLVLIWLGQTHTTCGTTGDTYVPNRTRGDKCVTIRDTFVLTSQGKHIRHVGLLGTLS